MRIFVCALLTTNVLAQSTSGETGTGFTIEQRLRHYVHRTYSWQRLALLGADTAVDHLLEEPQEWGQGPASFTYRYSSGFGRRLVRNSIELAAGIALREDTRFKRSQARTMLERLRWASTNSLLALDAHGSRRFAYSRLAATVGGTLVAATWQPYESSPQDYMESIGVGYLGHLQNSLLTEFSPDIIRLGRKVRSTIFGR